MDRPAQEPEAEITLEGTVRHTVYTNPASGFAVVRVEPDGGPEVTAVGPLLGIRRGDRVRLTGRWVEHRRFGRQLEVSAYTPVAPSTAAGIRRLLASGRVRGIGPKLAERIVARFGLETLEVMDRDPERLLEVPGIGPATLERIRASWTEHRGLYPVLVFLHAHGLGPAIAMRIHRRYGAAAVDRVRENPYLLAEEVVGVGFLTADRLARQLGIPEDAPERLRAGIEHTLSQAAQDGHVFLPAPELLARAADLLGRPAQELEDPLARLAGEGRVVVEDEGGERRVYPPRLHAAEASVARDLRRLLRSSPAPEPDPQRAVERFERSARIELADAQRRALLAALTAPVVVITGGPGTGKTTLVRGLVEIAGCRRRRLELAAPTGRAAQRLAEATGHPARTIHRLLEFSPADRAFARHRQRPLEADVLVVDEVSMLDVELAAALLAAVRSGCRLVLVGDADQLPSVGPGQVLGDLVASGAVPVVRLDRVFRQGERSGIVENAHRINRGEMPVGVGDGQLGDFYIVERRDPAPAADTVVRLVAERIPARFRLDPVRDVQVLTPMHRGELGVAGLNRRLQERLNPAGDALPVGPRGLRAGDKVMQTRNDYDLGVFNGDLGTVVGADPEAGTLAVRFDDRLVEYPPEAQEDLALAYACTIHKAQGSEYPAVVVVLHDQHWIMLQRNLLYTAVTRARRLVVIVGTRRAVARAVRTADQRRRHTRLAERLAGSGRP